jgi:general secretion pathway protein F/type IV pilus assembly protein PilC
MATFEYRARNAAGELVTGTLMADTSIAAARMLDERSLMPVEVGEAKQQSGSVFGGRKIKLSKIGVIYEQLSDLLRAGVPMLRALDVIATQAGNPAVARVIREVRDDISGGDSLAASMGKHPHAFPTLHVSTIRAGEAGGFLEDVLTRLSDFVERQDALRNKFIGSMIYPCILMGALLTAVVVLMSFVVPQIKPLLEGQKLQLPTIIVFGISEAFSKHFLVVGGVVMMALIAVIAFFQSGVGKAVWAQLQLRAPGVGRIYTMISICRFCRILGTMLANGIPILDALRIAKDSTGNPILADAVSRAAENVRTGEALAGPLAASKVFPPAITDMIAVAEESNTLEKVLVEIADTQEARTSRQIDLVVRMLEPLMLLFMGGLVLFIALALLLPILKMATSGLKG